MALEEIEIRLHLELRHDNDGRAGPQAEQQDYFEAVDVEEGEKGDQRVFAITQVAAAVYLQDVGDEVAMRQPHALGQSGRAARVRQRNHVVGRDRDVRRRSRLRDELVERRDTVERREGE